MNARGQRFCRSSWTVSPMSRAICRSSDGAMSRPLHRNSGAASVGVAILDVRTALAHGVETQPFEQPANLGGFEDGHGTHIQATAML